MRGVVGRQGGREGGVRREATGLFQQGEGRERRVWEEWRDTRRGGEKEGGRVFCRVLTRASGE